MTRSRYALCQVPKHCNEPSVCESSCPCYYSQIEGLGLNVYITHYVIRIKKHLHNRIEIIEIESNRKEYESLHLYRIQAFHNNRKEDTEGVKLLH